MELGGWGVLGTEFAEFMRLTVSRSWGGIYWFGEVVDWLGAFQGTVISSSVGHGFCVLDNTSK